MSECMRRRQLEFEELRKHQSEQVELLLQQNEEKEQKLKEENQAELEKVLQRMTMNNRHKEQRVRDENERAVAILMEQNEAREALMIAKHNEEERTARKVGELRTERNVTSAPNRPLIPECPVGSDFYLLSSLWNN